MRSKQPQGNKRLDDKIYDGLSSNLQATRRGFLRISGLVGAGLGLLGSTAMVSAVADTAEPSLSAELNQGMTESDLIYLSPVKTNGTISQCQAEVWFQEHNGVMYVVTDQAAWRAKAVSQGLTNTKVWVGDVGQWQSADGKYLKLPSLMASASFEKDATLHAAVLDKMGSKYRMSWLVWGPRFKNGLADGSRVMLAYRPTS